MYEIPQQIVQLQTYTHELVLSSRFCDIYPLLVNPFEGSVIQMHLSC
jgi:hypothetical protein